MDEIRSYTQDGQIGRPHFAQYLLKHELISTFAEAFNKYLGAGKIGDVKTGWPDIPTAVQWITEAGGIAVFAHGHHYKMTRTKLRACVRSEEHTSELQSRPHLVCRLPLEKQN